MGCTGWRGGRGQCAAVQWAGGGWSPGSLRGEAEGQASRGPSVGTGLGQATGLKPRLVLVPAGAGSRRAARLRRRGRCLTPAPAGPLSSRWSPAGLAPFPPGWLEGRVQGERRRRELAGRAVGTVGCACTFPRHNSACVCVRVRACWELALQRHGNGLTNPPPRAACWPPARRRLPPRDPPPRPIYNQFRDGCVSSEEGESGRVWVGAAQSGRMG